MSGHSKWNNIKHKKEKTDAQRAKVFTKVGKEMAVAVKEGGPDPVSNSKLAALIAKAKTLNVPNDNIDRIIKKASSADAADYEEITYEGYGPAGIAFIVQATTDSRNRTAGNVRHYFDKFGGNLGTVGCVSFMFEDKGLIVIEKEDVDEDQLMEDALEAGATDFIAEDEVFEIYTDVDTFPEVRDTLEAKGYTFAQAEIGLVPQNYIEMNDEEGVKNMTKLLDMFDDNDDVQNVYHNWEEVE
jgi:YebC/PmpR family DNA-binding regulatory protein